MSNSRKFACSYSTCTTLYEYSRIDARRCLRLGPCLDCARIVVTRMLSLVLALVADFKEPSLTRRVSDTPQRNKSVFSLILDRRQSVYIHRFRGQGLKVKGKR